jgi:hypothetical protein
MRVKLGDVVVEMDDDEFLTEVMAFMITFRKDLSSSLNVREVSPRTGILRPRAVEITVHSVVDALRLVPLLKVEPLTHYTLLFPKLGNSITATVTLHISSPDKIELWVQGKSLPGQRSGAYSAIINEFLTIYTECWDGANVNALYGRTCADLLRLFKGKDNPLQFIETQGHNWPLFCGIIAKLITCLTAAEGARCALMVPLTVMDLHLGKHGKRPLNPISNYTGSATDLLALEDYFECRALGKTLPPLTAEAIAPRKKMIDLAVLWFETVWATTKKKADYERTLKTMVSIGLPQNMLMYILEQKTLSHLDALLEGDRASLGEQLVDDSVLETQ